MTKSEFTTVVLKPEEDKYLTQAEDVDIRQRIIATTIALGKNDKPENWIEIDADKADEYRKLQQEAFEIDAKKAFEKASVK